VLRNLETYAKWSSQSLFPLAQPDTPTAVVPLLFLICVLAASTAMKRWTRRFDEFPSGARVLVVWLLGAMAIYFFLPNHVYRYYMTAALPALVGLILLGVRAGGALIRLPVSASNTLMALLTAVSVASSFIYFRQIDQLGLNQPYSEGTNNLVRRGATVTAVRDVLSMTHPRLAPQTVLVFKGVDLSAFDQHSGPQVWYLDPTIRAYDAGDLVEDHGRWFLRRPLDGQRNAHGGAVLLPIAGPLLFFEMTERGLVEREWPRFSTSVT